MAQAKVKARKKPTSKAKPAKPTEQPSTLKEDKARSDYMSLNPRKRALVDNYIDPTGDTFANGTRSYHKAVNGQVTIESARSLSAKLLATDTVRNAIEERMALKGASEDVRLGMLADIATGKYVKQSKTTYTDKDGETTGSMLVESTPSGADIVRVSNVIWRATGKYDINRAKASVLTARTKQLMKQFKPKAAASESK